MFCLSSAKSRLHGGFFFIRRGFDVVKALLLLSVFQAMIHLNPAEASRSCSDPVYEAGRVAVLDTMLQHAIQRKLISGAVILVGDHRGTLYEHATGKSGFEPNAPLLTTNTVFDLASLTKVFSTAPAVVRLLEQGALSLTDPVSRWFPEFKGSDINIMHLLTHTSGLNDPALDPAAPMESAIRKAAARQRREPAGTTFRYADINFIILGNIVRIISTMSLDQYCHAAFYQPLGMKKTGFNPASSGSSIAATINPAGTGSYNGVVQDYNARILGGVAGHAGLFSTVSDLGRFARMLLNNGQLDGRRILSPKSVIHMTAPYFFMNGKVTRGLGWDRNSPYSAPKGTLFSERSFGHTGYSGTSVWIDPDADLYVILLTTRINYNDRKSFNRLRSDISTLSAALFAESEKRVTARRPVNTHP